VFGALPIRLQIGLLAASSFFPLFVMISFVMNALQVRFRDSIFYFGITSVRHIASCFWEANLLRAIETGNLL